MEHHTFIILVFSFIKYGASDNFYDSLFSFLIYIYSAFKLFIFWPGIKISDIQNNNF